MSRIEQEIKHNIKEGAYYAAKAGNGLELGLNCFGKTMAMFWHEYSLEYQQGIGYVQIQQPSPMDRFLDRLLGGSRSIPKVVRIIYK